MVVTETVNAAAMQPSGRGPPADVAHLAGRERRAHVQPRTITVGIICYCFIFRLLITQILGLIHAHF